MNKQGLAFITFDTPSEWSPCVLCKKCEKTIGQDRQHMFTMEYSIVKPTAEELTTMKCLNCHTVDRTFKKLKTRIYLK